MINTPIYDDLYNQAKEDLKSKLGITALLGKAVLIPLAKVLAGMQKIIYSAITQSNRNVLPDLCDEATLLRHGKIKLRRTILAPTQGEYLCRVTGVSGAIIKANTTFTSNSGYVYVLDIVYTMPSGVGQITVRAITPGSIASLDVSQQLKSTEPIVDVDSTITVLSESVTPTEGETDSDYRTKVLQSYSRMPQGGARADFRLWTESVAGRREVYTYARQGAPTEIDLIIEAYPADSTDGKGTPTTAIINAVIAAIEPVKEPLGVAEIHYLPVALVPVDIDILELIDISTMSSLSTILNSMLYLKRPFIAGDDIPSLKDKGVLTISDVFNAIKTVIGSEFTNVTLYVDSVSVNKYTFEYDEIPYLRNLTNS
jgi:uncharacterized phage protein gp47/JayE